jgi:hypothetical protein
MSHFQHSFETLRDSELSLQDPEQEARRADWLVVWHTHQDDGLFFQTNVIALTREIDEIHGRETMRLVDGYHGEQIALIDPDAPNPAVALAASYAAEMEQGQHLDLGLYHRAQAEWCEERWKIMTLSDKMELVKTHAGSVRLAMQPAPPAIVMPSLMQTFE